MDAVASIPRSLSFDASGEPRLFDRVSGGHTTDARTARDVVFYRLGKKFVDNERSIPEDVRSVLYYTLAIGHHTGVIDCLDPRIGSSREVYADVLAALPAGAARDKLAGVERFGEIQLDKEHVPVLREATAAALEALREAPRAADATDDVLLAGGGGAGARPYVYAADALSWLEEFAVLLDEVASEPQVYAMGRRVTA